MIVHVKRDDGTIEQATAIAVVYEKPYQTEVFILNSNCEYERVFATKQGTNQIIPLVMFVDVHKYEYGWVKADKMEGYKLFVNHPELLERIRNGEKEIFKFGTDDQILFDSLIVNSDVNYGPIYVDGQDDIDNLLEFSGWFHDGTITEVKWNDKKTKLTLAFEGVWGIRKLYLHFSEDVILNLNDEYEYDYLFGASIFFENGKICFVGAEDYSSMKEDTTGITTVTAKSLSYSFEYGKPKKGARGGPETFQ